MPSVLPSVLAGLTTTLAARLAPAAPLDAVPVSVLTMEGAVYTRLVSMVAPVVCGGVRGLLKPLEGAAGVGATGVSQVVELVLQLRGEAGRRQVRDAKHGFALNFGGFGNNVVATVLSKGV